MPDKPVILLVDDAEDDVSLIRMAFRKAEVDNPVQVITNAEEALAYLRGDGKFADRGEFPLPELMLLDLKLPGRNGLELLSWVRQQQDLGWLRVVVVTSCIEPSEVAQAYALGANSLVVKPIDFAELVAMARTLRDYWFGTFKAPELSRPDKELPHEPELVAASNEGEVMALPEHDLHSNT
jgi:CheY-like chemotaxis protein